MLFYSCYRNTNIFVLQYDKEENDTKEREANESWRGEREKRTRARGESVTGATALFWTKTEIEHQVFLIK